MRLASSFGREHRHGLGSVGVALAALGILGGCGGGPGAAVAGGSSGSSSAGSSSSSGGDSADVTGTWVNRYFLSGGATMMKPTSFPAGIQAMVQQGTQWVTFPGTGLPDGSFVIPGVPQGPYLVGGELGTLVTSERVTDLGADYRGRPDIVQTQGTSNEITATMTGLDTWAFEDQVGWLSPNSVGAAFAPVGPGPSAGDTSLQGASFYYFGGLVAGSEGDVLYAIQTIDTITQVQQTTIARFASFTGLEQAPGTALDDSGAFTPTVADQSLSIDFRGTQFAALMPQVNPMAHGIARAGISTMPYAASAATLGGVQDLFDFASSSDVNLGQVHYADPFPPGFGQVLYASTDVEVPFPAPGGGAPAMATASVGIVVPIDKAGLASIEPLLSPVQAPQIDGQDAFGTLTGLSASPTLSWKPPSLGKPAGYEVLIHVITSVGPDALVGNGATFTTTGTSLTLPPGTLAAGRTYVFQIRALATAIDLAKQPFRASASGATADVITGTSTM